MPDKKIYSLLNTSEIRELGSIISDPNRGSINNPISNIISSDASEHMIINPNSPSYIKEKDSDTNQGAFLAPTDKASNATQSSEYGIEPPSAFSRLFAVQNLPLAHRITFGVSKDCWKSGDQFPFNFVIPKDVEIEKVDWSSRATKVMRDVGFFRSGPQHMGIGEMDGEALLIIIEEGFDWEKTDVSTPRDVSKPIVDTFSIPMFYVYRTASTVSEYTYEGLPKYWHININSIDGYSRKNAKQQKFHHSRIIHYNPDPLDTSSRGLCTLERSWQAICIGFNIDMGIGEAFFRWGIGHPVFETEFDSIEDLKAFMTNLGSPNRRTWHALLRGMKLNFTGAGGTALDSNGGKETAVYDEISIATGIPRPILKGEVAGVQTGSEVNERTYWGILRQKQTGYNDVVWKLLAILNESNQLDIPDLSYDPEMGILLLPEDTVIKWTVHYVETEEQRIDMLIKKLNILNPLKDVLTINELRAVTIDILNKPKDFYPPFPAPVGNQLLSIYADPYSLEPSMTQEQLANANLNSEPKDKKMTPTGELKGNTPTERLATATGAGKINEPSIAPSQPRGMGEERAKSSDENEDSSKIIGCPDHAHFNRTCPACRTILLHKEQMAADLLGFGFSINDVQTFINIDRNKVNFIRQNITKQENDQHE